MDNRSVKLKSRNLADYELSAEEMKLRRKAHKREIKKRRRMLEKQDINIDYEEDDSSGWEEMIDDIAFANSQTIDYYDYWNHPSFEEEKE